MSELQDKIKTLLGSEDVVLLASIQNDGSINLNVLISETGSPDDKVEFAARLLTFALEGVMIEFSDKTTHERWIKKGSAVASQLAAIQEAEKT